jgi:hypothetical protein
VQAEDPFRREAVEQACCHHLLAAADLLGRLKIR